MKIRMLENSIRLRLTQTEVQHFLDKGVVQKVVKFGAGVSTHLHYALQKAAVSEILSTYTSNGIQVLVPHTIAEEWATTKLVSISAEMQISEEEVLKILIEKDFKCLSDRAEEDESDMFPNPDEKHASC